MLLRPLLPIFIISGFILSALLLIPAHDFIFYHEQVRGVVIATTDDSSAFDYTLRRLWQTLTGRRFEAVFFFGLVGAGLGIIFYLIIGRFSRSRKLIKSLSAEIGRDLKPLIAKGESHWLEFKSSFRWDYRKEALNRALEGVVIKTIAAFMNADGGSLLIGVGDDGTIVGLDHDYSTLKTKNRDGFEVALMTAISSKLGTSQCSRVSILFHRVGNREVCHLIVSESPKPVFVTNGQETSFYVRAGAGTRELNIREATEYIAEHW